MVWLTSERLWQLIGVLHVNNGLNVENEMSFGISKIDEPEFKNAQQALNERYRKMIDMSANEKQVSGEHYKSRIQHWDYVVANELDYFQAQITKYITRWKKKNGFQDLLKAQHFLEKYIEVEGAKPKLTEEPKCDEARVREALKVAEQDYKRSLNKDFNMVYGAVEPDKRYTNQD